MKHNQYEAAILVLQETETVEYDGYRLSPKGESARAAIAALKDYEKVKADYERCEKEYAAMFISREKWRNRVEKAEAKLEKYRPLIEAIPEEK